MEVDKKEDMRRTITEVLEPIAKKIEYLNDVVTQMRNQMVTKEVLGSEVKSLLVKIGEVDEELSAKIEGMDEKLSAKIEGMDGKLSAKIEGVDKRLSDLWKVVLAILAGVLASLGAIIASLLR
jgi:hypothetical protein